MIVAYLTDQELTVLTGQPGIPARVEARYSLRLPKGCMRKGQVSSLEGFKGAVEGFWKDHELPAKDVKLVLDTKHFVLRSIDMPIIKKEADRRAYLSRELQSSARLSEPVFAYRVIHEDKKAKTCRMLVNSLDKASAENVIRAFERCGIEVTSLTSPFAITNAFIIGLHPGHEDQTALFLAASQEKATAFLYANGGYLYSTEQHLFTEYGTADFAGEIVRAVGNIEQFAQTQNLQEPIRHILLLGLTAQAADAVKSALAAHDAGYLVEEIREDEVVTSDSIVGSAELPELLPAVLALTDPEEGAGIVESWKDATGQNDGKKTRSAVLGALIAPAIALVACLAVILALNLWNMGPQGQIDAANDYLADPANTQAISNYQIANADNTSAQETNASADSLNAALESYPKPGKKIERVIAKCAKGLLDYQAVSYDASTGEYAISGTATDDETIHRFIKRLQRQTDVFTVTYTGYHREELTTSTAGKTRGVWVLDATLTLNDGAGE